VVLPKEVLAAAAQPHLVVPPVVLPKEVLAAAAVEANPIPVH
jgi:hypothetical protein